MKGKNQKKAKGANLGPKGEIFKKKFQGKCYNCDRQSHRFGNCKLLKREQAKKVNDVEEIT